MMHPTKYFVFDLTSLFFQLASELRFELFFTAIIVLVWSLSRFAKGSSRRQPRVVNRRAGKSEQSGSENNSHRDAHRMKVTAKSPRKLNDLSPQDLVKELSVVGSSAGETAWNLYEEALQKGTDFSALNLSTRDLERMYSSLLVSVLRQGLSTKLPQILKDMQRFGVPCSLELFTTVAKICISKKLFALLLEAHTLVEASLGKGSPTIWSCLLFAAVESGKPEKATSSFAQLKACGGKPSREDCENMVRVAASKKDTAMIVQLFGDLKTCGGGPSSDNVLFNRALAVCVSAKENALAERLLDEMECCESSVVDAVTYNTLMKGKALAGDTDACFELKKRMLEKKVEPTQVTYGILLDACINQNKVDYATEVFEDMVKAGCRLNTVLCTTLIKGFVRAKNVDQAMKVYAAMQDRTDVCPDLVTYSVLIKAHCDAAEVEKATNLLDDMVQRGFKPDEIVFNSLITGCVSSTSVPTGERLLKEMTEKYKVQPSCATFSVLIKLYTTCSQHASAMDMLANMKEKYGVEPEVRLFTQLVQACIRDRQGKRVLEAYQLMVDNLKSAPTAVNGTMLSMCVNSNMFETAEKLCDLVLRLSSDPAQSLRSKDVEAAIAQAMRKKKTQHARGILSSALSHGLQVSDKIREDLE